MFEDDEVDEPTQDETPETPEDKPVFKPDMIHENAREPETHTKEDKDNDSGDSQEKSES